jgi:phosphoribosylamine---glycine ligase
VLFAGLMITRDGPKLLEFNCRFGDPECQPVMMRLKSDLLAALVACRAGRLDTLTLEWSDQAALTVVLATKGYPGPYARGSEIRAIEDAEAVDGVVVFHAATRRSHGRLIADGGRVLGVTALGQDVAAARTRAYAAVARIAWPEGFYRTDIGWRALRP